MAALRDRLIRYVLERHEGLFVRVYDGLARHANADADLPPGGSEDPARGVVRDLARDGVAWWRGLYADPDFLASARADVDAACRLVEDRRAGELSTARTTVDPSGWTLSRPLERQGRTRVTVPRRSTTLPDSARVLMEDTRLSAVVRSYLGAESWVNYVLMERLEPALEGDFWHIDKLYDQVKAMVLLTDVDPEHGPVRYKPGTHRERPEALNRVLHQTLRHGLSWAYPPDPFVRELDAPEMLATGRAGDVLFLDTLTIHSGTRCRTDHRDLLVAAFNVKTRKNEFLSRLRV